MQLIDGKRKILGFCLLIVMNLDRCLPRLDSFPSPILHVILNQVSFHQLKFLSYVNRRLREVCVPYLFREVKCRFSSQSFDNLRSLTSSKLCHYVVSFTYTAPGIIEPGRDPIDIELISGANLYRGCGFRPF